MTGHENDNYPKIPDRPTLHLPAFVNERRTATDLNLARLNAIFNPPQIAILDNYIPTVGDPLPQNANKAYFPKESLSNLTHVHFRGLNYEITERYSGQSSVYHLREFGQSQSALVLKTITTPALLLEDPEFRNQYIRRLGQKAIQDTASDPFTYLLRETFKLLNRPYQDVDPEELQKHLHTYIEQGARLNGLDLVQLDNADYIRQNIDYIIGAIEFTIAEIYKTPQGKALIVGSYLTERFFRNEVAIYTKLRDKNIPYLLKFLGIAYNRTTGEMYMVFPAIQGPDYGTFLSSLTSDEERTITYYERLVWWLNTAEAIAGLHDNHIIHFDIKPPNVLVENDNYLPLTRKTRREEVVESRVFDLGYSDDQDSPEPPITGVGTPPYAAPELYIGAPPSVASDIYALGMMLYASMIGKELHPDFRSETVNMDENIPQSLKIVLMKAIAYRPSQRYQNVRELINAFLSA